MKLTAAVQLSVLISLAVSTACGAAAKKQPSAGATHTATAVIVTPELQSADSRVKQAEGQLALAKKQLKAAQSILKAAEADLKAARAERQAIALRTQAQELAQTAGMRPEGNRALAEVDSAAVTARNGGNSTAAGSLTEAAPPADSVSPQLDLR